MGGSLGMKIIALKRDVSKIEPERKACVDELVDFSGFDKLCSESDYIITILPATEATRNFFDKTAFAKMKPSCCFINIGRGDSVVEDDLVAALESKQIAGASLDVFTPEPLPKTSKLWDFENVFITPHTADMVEGLLLYACDTWKEHMELRKAGKPLKNV